MTALLLALVSAVGYGASDFVGGTVSRRTSAWAVAFVVQLTSGIAFVAAAPFFAHAATGEDLAWGVVAGVGSGVGIGFLFRGFAAGRMSVVAPLSAVGAAVIPAVVGFALGERIGVLVLLGLLLGLPGIWLVSSGEDAPGEPHADARPRSTRDRGLLDGGLAGVGFALCFLGLDQVESGAGMWPLATMQGVSAGSVAVLALLLRGRVFPLPRPAWRAWYAGPIGSLAGLAFYLATGEGLLTVTSVLASLYPAVTILLAVALLGERIHRVQAAGLLLCAACVGLVVIG